MTISDSPVRTRRFEDADLPEVLEVLGAALGETPLLRRTAELFAWKHQLNPFGVSTILLATVGDRIAGVRAVMRWELALPDGTTVRCGRMVDTATHPDFQRMGIFRRLTNEVVEEVTGEGIELLFNTPNPRSGAGYLSMGWETVGPIGVMVRPGLGLLGRKRRRDDTLPRPEDFVRNGADGANVRADDRAPLGARTPRSRQYLKWRFGSHPTARYVTVGAGESVAVARPNHRSGRRELVVSDLIGPRPRPALAALAKASEADYLVGWFSHGTPERSGAMAAGLIPVPRVSALTLVARPLVDLGPEVHDPGWWDLAMGDLELL